MEKPKTTPKDFFLWAGAMLSFYWSVLAFIFLVFNYIEYSFPNALSYYPVNPYESGISMQMASIIVLLPLYLWLARIITKSAETDPSRKDIWVRRWAIIFTLFIAGVAMAGDLITLLTSFLSGEALTTAFLLKTALVLLVAAGVFLHFMAELKEYWVNNPGKKRIVRASVGVLAVVTIVAGFFIVGTPQQARRERFDAERVSQLQIIQSDIVQYWQAKKTLPKTLSELGSNVTDPETGAAFRYEMKGDRHFTLCAVFNAPNRAPIGTQATYARTTLGGVSEDWTHTAGEVCFDRTIDPSFYTKQPY